MKLSTSDPSGGSPRRPPVHWDRHPPTSAAGRPRNSLSGPPARPRWSTGSRTDATSARLATFGPVVRLSMSNGRVTAGSPSLPRDQKVPYCDSARVWRSRFGPISPPALRLALLSPHNMESMLRCSTNRVHLSHASPRPMPVRDPASKCRPPSTVAQGRPQLLSLLEAFGARRGACGYL